MASRQENKWDGEPFDPTIAKSTDDAVFIGRQFGGDTIIVGREEQDEWIWTSDIRPLKLRQHR